VVVAIGTAIEKQTRAIEFCMHQLASGALELSVSETIRERRRILSDLERLRERLLASAH